jgi:Ca2+-binding RTX toxin-like protein
MSAASSGFDVTVSNTIPSIAVSINNFLVSTKGAGLLMGTSEANSTVAVYDTATDKCIGQTTADTSGSWSLVVTGLIPNCAQGFAAIAHDQLGNIGAAACIYGTKGNDTLTSTLADEIFTGNGGCNTFVFSGDFGNDTIKDFQTSSDVVQLDRTAFGDFAGVMNHASQVGSDVVISVDANHSVSLHNTLLSQLTANNVHLV